MIIKIISDQKPNKRGFKNDSKGKHIQLRKTRQKQLNRKKTESLNQERKKTPKNQNPQQFNSSPKKSTNSYFS